MGQTGVVLGDDQKDITKRYQEAQNREGDCGVNAPACSRRPDSDWKNVRGYMRETGTLTVTQQDEMWMIVLSDWLISSKVTERIMAIHHKAEKPKDGRKYAVNPMLVSVTL